MNTEQKQLDTDSLLQRLVETPTGERIRMKCGAADLRSVITDLLSLVKSQETERILPHWSEPPHDCTAFNGLLEPLAHALSSITSGTRPNVKVPDTLAEKVWSELWQAERELLAIQERTDAASMRSACVEKVGEILSGLMIELPPVSDSYLKGQGWNAALARANNELVPALESVSIQEQEAKQ